MKRVLLASTALCLGAGTAFAQDAMMDGPSVALSGSAEMGVAGEKDKSVRFHTDIDVTFKATGTMDSGVTWSADVDLDEGGTGAPAHANDDDDGGVTISISQPEGFGTLTMGDVDGALDWAMDEIGSGGIRDDSEHWAYSGNGGLDAEHDNQILQWNRVIGSGFSLGASVELFDHDDDDPSHDPIIGLGGKYSMGMGAGTLDLGGGFQMGSFDRTVWDGTPNRTAIWGEGSDPGARGGVDDTLAGHEIEGTMVGGSAKMDFGGDMGGIAVTLNASMGEMDGSRPGTAGTVGANRTMEGEYTHLGLGLSYTVGAISLGANVGSEVYEYTVDRDGRADRTNDVTMFEEADTGVGFDVAYDLGGGASLKFGFGSSEKELDWDYESGVAPVRPSNAAAGSTRNEWHDTSSDTNKWSLGVAFKF